LQKLTDEFADIYKYCRYCIRSGTRSIAMRMGTKERRVKVITVSNPGKAVILLILALY
jgi:hypothetical protein